MKSDAFALGVVCDDWVVNGEEGEKVPLSGGSVEVNDIADCVCKGVARAGVLVFSGIGSADED